MKKKLKDAIWKVGHPSESLHVFHPERDKCDVVCNIEYVHGEIYASQY